MAEPRSPGWSWLTAAPMTGAGDELAAAFARCFTGADGARVLQHLRVVTLERSLGPDAPDTALRHLEGQRQLVQAINALVARGRAGPALCPAH
ncbi:MAG: hypothetical protein WCO00_11165 [Rhodospirillaceae bacterium]